MAERKSIQDGRNRCRRCNRPLSNPNAIYGWRCAQIVGLEKYSEITDILDEDALNAYNMYVSTYLANDKSDYNDSAITSMTNSIISSILPATDWQDASDIIVRNADAIKNAGAYYGVNPGIIAACIYTEQITNVNITDLADLPFYFADTSIGIGQIKVSTAKMLEDSGYIQKTEYAGTERIGTEFWGFDLDVWHAPAYGYVYGSRERAIAHRLTVESENVNYVAAYLSYFQDRWKGQYPEIDGRTAVLATLFNQGETRPPHPNPEPREFGNQARDEYPYMRKLLGLD